MDSQELVPLLRTESDRVEWKESAKNADDVLQPVCALANDLGGSGEVGWVLFGVRKDGSVVGVDTRGRRLDESQQAEQGADEDSGTFPPLENWLTNRRGLGQAVAGIWRPTAAAILLYGKSPQDWLPGAVVEFVRYGGRDVDSPVVARRTATGTLPSQLEILWAQIEAHLDDVPVATAGIREGFVPRFPLEALKELVRNLVQHRQYEGTNAPGRVEWYEDRIEFSNPGGPFGRASEGVFGEHSDYRNPSVTKGLVELGYLQELGRGIRRVRLQLEKLSCPPLEVATDGFTRVTVRGRS